MLAEVQVRWDLAVLQGEDHLHEPGDSRRCLEVTDVGLDRPHEERPGTVPEHLRQRVELDRVPEARPGPVGLDVVHVPRRQAGVLERSPDDGALRVPVGCGEPAAPAVVVHRRAG